MIFQELWWFQGGYPNQMSGAAVSEKWTVQNQSATTIVASDILPEVSGIQLLFAWSPKVITNGLCTLCLFVVRGKIIQAIPFQFFQKHKEKGIILNTTLQKKHTSKKKKHVSLRSLYNKIIISIDQKTPSELIVPSSSPFVCCTGFPTWRSFPVHG